MEYHSHLENLDEDGYTQLDFSSRGNFRRPVDSKKGTRTPSPTWRLIAVALGILCLVTLVTATVLGALGYFSGPCPPNWIIHKKSCYLLSMSLNSWYLSKKHCNQLGSNLLKIDNTNELDFLKIKRKDRGSGKMDQHSLPTCFKSETQLPKNTQFTTVYGYMGQRSITKCVVFPHSASVRSSCKCTDGNEGKDTSKESVHKNTYTNTHHITKQQPQQNTAGEPSVVVQAFNLSTREAEAGGSLRDGGQFCLHSEFQAGCDYMEALSQGQRNKHRQTKKPTTLKMLRS